MRFHCLPLQGYLCICAADSLPTVLHHLAALQRSSYGTSISMGHQALGHSHCQRGQKRQEVLPKIG